MRSNLVIQARPWSDYFVSIRGTLERVDDLNEYNKAIALLRETGKTSSPKFLEAHGIDLQKDGTSSTRKKT